MARGVSARQSVTSFGKGPGSWYAGFRLGSLLANFLDELTPRGGGEREDRAGLVLAVSHRSPAVGQGGDFDAITLVSGIARFTPFHHCFSPRMSALDFSSVSALDRN